MKINGINYEDCKTCGSYQTYDASGKCERCGRQLIRESTSDMIADFVERGYITN